MEPIDPALTIPGIAKCRKVNSLPCHVLASDLTFGKGNETTCLPIRGHSHVVMYIF
jgi:hypothetical protein